MTNITNIEFDQAANGQARSIWRCHSCDTGAELLFSDLADAGTPICGECGDDMALVNVIIDEEKCDV